jgi:hypothetical protein
VEVAVTSVFSNRLCGVLACLLIARHGEKKKRTRQKRKGLYSRSEKNIIIDSLVHPLADQHWSFAIVDGVLHAVNKEDPIQSLFKFSKYNAPELLKRILREIQ